MYPQNHNHRVIKKESSLSHTLKDILGNDNKPKNSTPEGYDHYVSVRSGVKGNAKKKNNSSNPNSARNNRDSETTTGSTANRTSASSSSAKPVNDEESQSNDDSKQEDNQQPPNSSTATGMSGYPPMSSSYPYQMPAGYPPVGYGMAPGYPPAYGYYQYGVPPNMSPSMSTSQQHQQHQFANSYSMGIGGVGGGQHSISTSQQVPVGPQSSFPTSNNPSNTNPSNTNAQPTSNPIPMSIHGSNSNPVSHQNSKNSVVSNSYSKSEVISEVISEDPDDILAKLKKREQEMRELVQLNREAIRKDGDFGQNLDLPSSLREV